MNLLIAGGGTGGHLYPGVAVAEELLARPGEHCVLFAGTERGIEARVLPKLGLPFRPVRAGGLVGTGVAGKLRGARLLAGGLLDAARLVGEFRPHACLGVGGYASFPVIAWAGLRGVPSAVQEQNARPGLANRVLARAVRRIYAGDEAAVGWFPPAKTLVTGNPLRSAFHADCRYAAPEPDAPARLLVLGGSQGARALNEKLPGTVARLPRMEVLHQAGRGNAEAVAERYGPREGVRVVEFIDEMAAAYEWAHLIVGRAGALTLAELAAAGRPAVLVPFPFSAGGHQVANARAAEARGAALTLLEQDLTEERLAGTVGGLLEAPGRLASMAEAARKAAPLEAAQRIVDDLLAIAGCA